MPATRAAGSTSLARVKPTMTTTMKNGMIRPMSAMSRPMARAMMAGE